MAFCYFSVPMSVYDNRGGAIRQTFGNVLLVLCLYMLYFLLTSMKMGFDIYVLKASCILYFALR